MLRIQGNRLSLLTALSLHWAHQQLQLPAVPPPPRNRPGTAGERPGRTGDSIA